MTTVVPDGDFDWAGLEDDVDVVHVEPSVARSLIGYFRDCAVVNQRSLKLHDVFDDPNAGVLGIADGTWDELASDGLHLEGREAMRLALTNQAAGRDKPILVGALFVVGRYRPPGRPGRPSTICAPLLLGNVAQTHDAASASFLLEGDVALNLSLLALLTSVDAENEEEMRTRFEALMDVVPDAPLSLPELNHFVKALSVQLDLPFDLPTEVDVAHVDLADARAQGGELRLICSSALFLFKEAAELSVIRELEAIAQVELDGTALLSVLDPESHSGERDIDQDAPVEFAGAMTPFRPPDWHDGE